MKTERPHSSLFLFTVVLFFVLGFSFYASAQLTGSITTYLTQEPVEAVLLAELGDRDRHEIVIIRAFFGDLNVGDTMAIDPDPYARQFDLSLNGQRLQKTEPRETLMLAFSLGETR